MKIIWEKNCIIYECSVCSYKYKEKNSSDPNRFKIDDGFGKEPFLEGIHQFIHEEKRDYGPSVNIKKNVYVCPKCGVMQINPD